ncbi:enoyl-CoA hydratase/isomerase family protein [Ottowia thiooxydans]|uniref:enoyl-CoA hydratase/isomerase family protein n=1 Tax=Ottowia thiooxydans TaxID=219182 RepID=UPI000406DE5A|nr:enoyl-CoA hydratase/isomerase family protein [Ottowia thiooxydans]
MSAVIFEIEGSIAHIRLNRPEALNSFNLAMFQELNAAIDQFRNDKSLKVAVISGEGKRAFSAGVDLKAMKNSLAGEFHDSDYEIPFAEPGYLDKPVVAAIRGWCVGEGMHLALACDFRVCASDAIFSVPEVAVGMPLIRLSSQCVRALGLPAAVELCFLGEKKDAAWALAHQLVHRVSLPGEELGEAMRIAKRLCDMSAPALQLTKKTLYKSLDHSYGDVYKFGIPLRQEVFRAGDAGRAVDAFVNTRSAADSAAAPNAKVVG